MVLSDRIAVMRGGRLQQIGPPMEVYRRPVNQFVAGFIGSPAMNFFTGELLRQDGKLLCQVAGRRCELPLDCVAGATLAELQRPRPVVLGLRPTDLALAVGHDIALEGDVFLVEPIGPVSYVDVNVAGQPVKGACEPDDAPAIAARVTLGAPASRVHLFDPKTEQRL